MADFPEGQKEQDRDLCLAKLEEAQLRYIQERTPEARAQFREALTMFADLTLQGKLRDG